MKFRVRGDSHERLQMISRLRVGGVEYGGTPRCKVGTR